MYRVLSIDFDVFQKIPDISILNKCPEGIDRSTAESCECWQQHYAKDRQERALSSITINEKRLTETIELIRQGCRQGTPIKIVNSHKEIYQWILDGYHMPGSSYDGIRLAHLDMHHDIINDCPELNCGNWVKHIKQSIPNTDICWICNAISKEVYGLNTPEFSFLNDDVAQLIGEKYDALFICRSDTWLPPHLDKYFSDFCEEALRLVGKECAEIEQDILLPRKISIS